MTVTVPGGGSSSITTVSRYVGVVSAVSHDILVEVT